MTLYAHITGWGMAVPEKVLTNNDIAKMVDTNDDWIITMTGIKERHVVVDGQTTASLGIDAALPILVVRPRGIEF